MKMSQTDSTKGLAKSSSGSSLQNSSSTPLDFPSVLSFLQKEYRKMESERQLWELERVEYKRTINFLESSRKSHERIQYDLIRRVKMLELVLKNERLKFSSLVDHIKKSGCITSDSVEREQLLEFVEKLSISPPVARSTITNNTTTNKSSSAPLLPQQQSVNIEFPPKSSQILRKCLEELECSDIITLLSKIDTEYIENQRTQSITTTTSTLTSTTTSEQSDSTISTIEDIPTVETARVLSKDQTSPTVATASVASVGTENVTTENSTIDSQTNGDFSENLPTEPQQSAEEDLNDIMSRKFPGLSRHLSSGRSKKSKKKSISEVIELEPNNSFGEYAAAVKQDADSITIETTKESKKKKKSSKSDSSSIGAVSVPAYNWKPKYVLQSHLDSVRALCFHTSEPILITASEDWTLKMWNVDMLSKKYSEPVHTFRAHTGPVFTVKCSEQYIYSAGEDGSIRVWNYPPFDHDPYTNHGFSSPFEHTVLTGHNDVIWSLSIMGNTLLSASSDDTIRVWNVPKIASYRPDNDVSPSEFVQNVVHMDHLTPTCVTHVQSDATKFVVSSTTGDLALYDVETGKQIWKHQIQSNITDSSKLIYRVVSHSVLPLLVTGCEDSKIRFHDLNTGKLTISENNVLGHSDAVSALSISSDGQYLMSGGYDCSLRIWDIQTRNCVQEIPTHRRKYTEGIHDVSYHQNRTLTASCGADSLVKIYS